MLCRVGFAVACIMPTYSIISIWLVSNHILPCSIVSTIAFTRHCC